MDYRQPDLSVITVNYNGFHDTCEFIDSWAATVFSVSYEMIVIDNGSTANEAANAIAKERNFVQSQDIGKVNKAEIKEAMDGVLKKMQGFDFTTSIPFIKPMFYCFKIFIFRTPAFRINNIFCKNFIYS